MSDFKKVKLSYFISTEKTGKASGKPYTSVGIKIEGQDFWINGFGNNITAKWEKGAEVDIRIYEEEFNGKMGWRFETKKPADVIDERLSAIEDSMNKVLSHLKLPIDSMSAAEKIVAKIDGEPDAIPPPDEELPF